MTVKEMRALTGMSRIEFSKYFGIPVRTIQNWELEGSESRKCPVYLADLMEYKLRNENLIKKNA